MFFVYGYFLLVCRDLGEYIRKQLKASLRAGDISSKSEVCMDRQFQALERLSNNIHFKTYSRSRDSTSTGLNCEQCKIVISDSSLKHMNEESKKGFFNRNKTNK